VNVDPYAGRSMMNDETKKVSLDGESREVLLAAVRGNARAEALLGEVLRNFEAAVSDVEYAKKVLSGFDVYRSGGLDGMVREASTRVDELGSRVEELLRDASRLENERRSWKSRHEIQAQVIASLIGMIGARFGAEETPLLGQIAALYRRADLLEKDAWCGAADLARKFVEQAEELGPRGTAWSHTATGDFLSLWRDRFRAVLK